MKFSQRDIVEINFHFPNGDSKPHPAIIVSNDELFETEGFFYFVLISSKDYNKQYCYDLTVEMTTMQFLKKSFVKCHLIVGDTDRVVLKKLGRIKKQYFDEVVDKIFNSIF